MTRMPIHRFKGSNVEPFNVLGLLIFGLVGLLNLVNLERASAQTPFYQGKTIRIVVAINLAIATTCGRALTSAFSASIFQATPSSSCKTCPAPAR